MLKVQFFLFRFLLSLLFEMLNQTFNEFMSGLVQDTRKKTKQNKKQFKRNKPKSFSLCDFSRFICKSNTCIKNFYLFLIHLFYLILFIFLMEPGLVQEANHAQKINKMLLFLTFSRMWQNIYLRFSSVYICRYIYIQNNQNDV